MHSLLPPWFDDASQRMLLDTLANGGIARGVVSLFVVIRLAGFFCIGPLLGRSIVSWPVRLSLVLLLTLIVAPGIPLAQSGVALVNHEEVLLATDNALVSETMNAPAGFVVAAFGNVVIGASLGFAVAMFLSGLRLGGAWLDRHSGLDLGGVLNPEYNSGGSAAAELAFLFCVAAILLMQPINGHLLIVRLILDSFTSIPVTVTLSTVSLSELMKSIVQQSLILGLRIAMPFVVAMSLFDMTLGWVRRSSRWDLAPATLVFRTGASLLILAATFPGIHEAVTSSVLDTLKITRDNLLATNL